MRHMKAIQTYLKNHPFIFAAVALIFSRIAGLGIIGLIQIFKPDLSIQDDLGWLLMLLFAAVTVSFVYWTNTSDEIGLCKPPFSKEWLTVLPLLALPLFIVIVNGIDSWGISRNIVLLIAAIGVAVNEEVLFRGILLRGFMKWGPWVAIFVPSILFGLAHASNIFTGGDITFAVFQTIWTFAAGVMLSAMRLRNKSLYPVILFHFILDGVEYFSTGEFGVHSEEFPILLLAALAALNVILAVYAVVLYHKSTKRPGDHSQSIIHNFTR